MQDWFGFFNSISIRLLYIAQQGDFLCVHMCMHTHAHPCYFHGAMQCMDLQITLAQPLQGSVRCRVNHTVPGPFLPPTSTPNKMRGKCKAPLKPSVLYKDPGPAWWVLAQCSCKINQGVGDSCVCEHRVLCRTQREMFSYADTWLIRVLLSQRKSDSHTTLTLRAIPLTCVGPLFLSVSQA